MSSLYMNSRRGVPVPQTVTVGAPRCLGLVELAQQRRDHVAVFGW